MKPDDFNRKLAQLVDLFCEEQLGSSQELDENETVRQFLTWLEQLYEVGGMGKTKERVQ